MCRQLDLPRATYYRWPDAAETPTALRRRELTGQVKTVFDSSDGIFGHRMVHTKLAAAGIEVSVGTVAGIMAENGWAAKRLRAFKRTTIPSDPDKVFADLIGRDFTSGTPGTRLVGEITYLRTNEGWLYLATVIDLCTRMVIGWAMADHMRTELCTGALAMTRDRGHLTPGTIFHSDSETVRTGIPGVLDSHIDGRGSPLSAGEKLEPRAEDPVVDEDADELPHDGSGLPSARRAGGAPARGSAA
jgi:putative transposase